MNKVSKSIASIALGIVLGAAMSVPVARAATKHKVDCDAVMQELNSGKKAKEVAKDQNISVSSVRRCKAKAKKAAAASAKAGNEGGGAPSASASPASPKKK